ncbi:MAG: hypothetical protein ACRD29_09220 [Acidimicrobiales bacterium]
MGTYAAEIPPALTAVLRECTPSSTDEARDVERLRELAEGAANRPDDTRTESPSAQLHWLTLHEANTLGAEDNLA